VYRDQDSTKKIRREILASNLHIRILLAEKGEFQMYGDKGKDRLF
jgi:hypothetical protein